MVSANGSKMTNPVMKYFFMICFCPFTYGQSTIKILQLHHRPAEEIARIVRPLLGTNETVTADGFQLIVKADLRQIEDMEQLIKTLDKKRHRLFITVAQGKASSLKALDAGIRIRTSLFRKKGAARQTSIGGHLYQSSGSEQDQNTQFIQTLEGQAAHIQFGQQVPYPETVISAGNTIVMTVPGTQFQDVTTGFTVVPTLNGDSVRLKISPWARKLSTLNDGTMETQETVTTVRTALGEWVRLGGQTDNQSLRHRGILSTTRTTGKTRNDIFVRVDDLDGE